MEKKKMNQVLKSVGKTTACPRDQKMLLEGMKETQYK